MIERDIRLAKLTGVHYHVARSTRDGIDNKKSQKEGVKITCDTAHPILLSMKKLLSYNTAFKLLP